MEVGWTVAISAVLDLMMSTLGLLSVNGYSEAIHLNYVVLDEDQVPSAPMVELVGDGVIQLGGLDLSMFWQYRIVSDSDSDGTWSSDQTGNTLQITPDLVASIDESTKIEFKQIDKHTGTASASLFVPISEIPSCNIEYEADSTISLIQSEVVNNIIVGNDSDLTVYGGAGADLLTNFHVGDVFIGGAGIDTIQLNTSNFINDVQNTSASIIRISRMSDDAWSAISSGYNNALLEADPSSQIAQGPAFYIENNEGSGIFQGEKIHFIDASGLVIDQISIDELAPGLVGLHLSNLDHHFLAGLAGDNVLGGWGNDVLVGNGGNDYLLGAGGNDILVGGAIDSENPFAELVNSKNPLATSQLFGGSGSDTLVAMDGEVRATGGDGNDIFAFYETHANQNIKLWIKDLELGDQIDLSYLYSGSDFRERLDSILDNAALNKLASDGSRTVNLSSLTEESSDNVILKIEQSQNSSNSSSDWSQLSSQFIIENALNWHSDLDPLVNVM